MRREIGSALIWQWKINKSLYEAYGGHIIYQQLGPEPLDDYHQYLDERQKTADFRIDDPAIYRCILGVLHQRLEARFHGKGQRRRGEAFRDTALGAASALLGKNS